MPKAWEPPDEWKAYVRTWWPIVESTAFWAAFRNEFPNYVSRDLTRTTAWMEREKKSGKLIKRPI